MENDVQPTLTSVVAAGVGNVQVPGLRDAATGPEIRGKIGGDEIAVAGFRVAGLQLAVQVLEDRSGRVEIAVVDVIAARLEAGGTRIECRPAVRGLHVVDEHDLLVGHEGAVEIRQRTTRGRRHDGIRRGMEYPHAGGL